MSIKNSEVCCEGTQAKNFRHSDQTCRFAWYSVYCSTMETASVRGSRYYINFQNDFSRMCLFIFWNRKIKLLKNVGFSKSNLNSNWEGNVGCPQWSWICQYNIWDIPEKQGITHQTTNSYIPEQNRRSEWLWYLDIYFRI